MLIKTTKHQETQMRTYTSTTCASIVIVVKKKKTLKVNIFITKKKLNQKVTNKLYFLKNYQQPNTS